MCVLALFKKKEIYHFWEKIGGIFSFFCAITVIAVSAFFVTFALDVQDYSDSAFDTLCSYGAGRSWTFIFRG